jgi:serine phosphatase RsbU (regulator of sigma subunit)
MIDTQEPADHGTSALPAAHASLDTRVTVWNSPALDARAGGDWSEMFAIATDVVGLTIGDVSGHGAAVAATMKAMSAAVVAALRDVRVPSDALATANIVAHDLCAGVVVTAIAAVLDHRLGTLTFANAGHPPPLLVTSSGHAFLTQTSADLPLGIFSRYRAADYVIALPPDALVVFYTDGVTEHDRDPIVGELELVAATQRAHRRRHLNDARAIAREVFVGGRGTDDAAAIALRTPPTDPRVRNSRRFAIQYRDRSSWAARAE